MELLSTERIHCPYCGESFDIIIDCSVESQSYIEDCQICCRPISISVSTSPDQEPVVSVRHEND
ncbi:MAG: CPXCG motif-containing cysteine-rich protein [Granulosicoccus sp.]